jgi:hypothetical protein
MPGELITKESLHGTFTLLARRLAYAVQHDWINRGLRGRGPKSGETNRLPYEYQPSCQSSVSTNHQIGSSELSL